VHTARLLPAPRSAQHEGEKGSLTFNGDTTILTRPQAGREEEEDIAKQHSRALGGDAQIVRPSTAVRSIQVIRHSTAKM
jgi:hypothetical protein